MTSPGPGWWQASDGEWYPQQWEYNYFATSDKELGKAMAAAGENADKLGKQGWEMVNSSVVGYKTFQYGQEYSISAYLVAYYYKRPLKH